MTIIFSSGHSSQHTLTVDIPTGLQEEVKLSDRQLSIVPETVHRNVYLKVLDLSHNLLEDCSLGQLTDLRNLLRLNLSANLLRTFSGCFPFLEVLCLSGNQMESLHHGLMSMHRLQRLHCDFNRLNRLPDDWSSLNCLTCLTLSGNRLEEVPDTLWKLQSLEVLHLQRNRIRHISPLPVTSRIRELRLAWNGLSGKVELESLQSLVHLDVSHNNIDDLTIYRLQRLETLMASGNSLKVLRLDGAKLRSLVIDGNEVTDIVCKNTPSKLEILDISHNRFRSLPDWIAVAESVRALSAEHNLLKQVSKEIFECCHLEELKLNHNLLTQLPNADKESPIRSLTLQYNDFETLPESFFSVFQNLEVLNVSCNRISSLPRPTNPLRLRKLLLSGNKLQDMESMLVLLAHSKIDSLHLANNDISQLPNRFFESCPFVRTLSLSGNHLECLPSQVCDAHNLEKLYLHTNKILAIPKFEHVSKLKVLDLACNKIQQVELAAIVPSGLTYLDLSSNNELRIDPSDFHHLCCQRPVAVVDVNCAGRQAPLTDSPSKATENTCPWILGFTESQDGYTRIYIEFQKDCSGSRQEALIALMELDDLCEVGHLRQVLPEILHAERKSDESNFLKNSLLATIKYLREHGYTRDLGMTLCHLSSSGGIHPVALRLAAVGRPSSCILGRAGNGIVLAQRQEAPLFDTEEWSCAMQAAEVCQNNHLSNIQPIPAPRITVPEPEVRELVLSPQDKFLVFGDSGFSATVPTEEVCRQLATAPTPVAASKSLAELYSSLANGKRECVAVVTFRSEEAQPVEEEVEKYRCWEFMLEQNHKLLFTRELETIHKTILHKRETITEPPAALNGEDPSTCWYTSAISKYKCPLPSHRGRYYCYGNKAD